MDPDTASVATWASEPIRKLRAGETVRFRPRGHSMAGRIESGQLVTVEPLTADIDPQVGDVVLCKVGGRPWLHLVTAVGADGRFQIGNNRGRINGWCTRANVFGIVIAVQD